MGLNFSAVLGHEIDAEDLRTLPRLLSAARAPQLVHAIGEFAHYINEYRATQGELRTMAYDVTDTTWHVDPTSIPLYRDAVGNLTLQAPPPIEEEIGPGRHRVRFAPVAARRTVSMEEYWAAGNLFDVAGPAGIGLDIGPHALRLTCGPRWWPFLAEPAVQLATRRVCHELARVVGSPLAIYLADGYTLMDAIMEGATIEQIVAQLSAKLGPPEPALTMLDEETTGDEIRDAYYLDTFADL